MLDSKKNIVLIGYRCTGKTTIGKKLSEKLKMPFYDTDDLIKKETGRSIPDLVSEKGWGFFRQKEREIIECLSILEGCIFATGGGAIQDKENAANLKRNGIFIWLSADIETIAARMSGDQHNDGRPSLTGQDAISEISEVLLKRLPHYKKLADFSIDTSTVGADDAVEQIIQWIRQTFKRE